MSAATSMTLKPRMSEKAFALSKQQDTYVFIVPRSASKLVIAESVSAQFGVKVEAVNVANIKGKVKRSYRRGGRPISGKDSDYKKAFVRLKSGDQIPIFAAVEEEEAKAEKTAAAMEKAAAKKAKKDAK